LKSVLIANRGEIAVRIIKTCQEMGIRSVQVYSEADRDSLAVKMADESINIGPPQALKSYLNHEAILEAARSSKVDAIHPGYGFLSENAEFAANVEKSGVIFLGPSSESIRILGDKVKARKLAVEAGVKVVPGTEGGVSTTEEAISFASQIGFPVMIKAAAGGGGKGIRVAANTQMLKEMLEISSAEAKAAFGDGTLYLEKVVENARHVEVQFMGDGKSYVHCFERECSVQRRRQKVWEEAPAIGISDDIRNRICEAALSIAQKAGYVGIGTVEFLYDTRTTEFYFIEVNTRIQVEHPVTEMITGIDLVRVMIEIASTGELPLTQKKIQKTGHAIECRINAEDPFNDFFPSPGCVDRFLPPEGAGVRFDSMLFEGYTVPPYYDSLLGKLIVSSSSRAAALEKMDRALDDIIIEGIRTTIPLHKRLVSEKQIQAGNFDINFLENMLVSDQEQRKNNND